jgi:hypothetical protein
MRIKVQERLVIMCRSRYCMRRVGNWNLYSSQSMIRLVRVHTAGMREISAVHNILFHRGELETSLGL